MLYSLTSTNDTASNHYGCDTSCVYEKNAEPGSRFCFRTGLAGGMQEECTSDGNEGIVKLRVSRKVSNIKVQATDS